MPKRRARGEAKNAAAPFQGGRSGVDDGDFVTELQPDDILVGRGFQYEGNPGNAVFQEAIESAVAEYNAAPTRKDKTKVVQRIYDELSQTSRFLRFDADTGRGTLCTIKEAKQKISHALRYRSQLDATEDQNNVLLESSLDFKVPAATSTAAAAAMTQQAHTQQAHASSLVTAEEASKRESFGDTTTDSSSKKRKREGQGDDVDDNDEGNDDDDASMFSGGQLESVLGLPHEYHQAGSTTQQQQQRQGAAIDESNASLVQPEGLAMMQVLSRAGSSSVKEQEQEAIRVGETELSSLEGDSPPKEEAKPKSFGAS